MPDETAADRFTIRRFREGDEKAILDLFARSFHVTRSREHFDWKYRRNPFGQEHISVAFDQAGALAGQYAAYAVPFRNSEHDGIAHQVGDTMTDVSVRHVGRGPTSILGRTALHFYENFCDGRVDFNYGFNVANIQKFSLRFLRSDRVEPVPYRRRELTADPLVPLGRFERWMRAYRLEEVHQCSEEWDRFFDRVWRAYGFLVRRDAAYIRWRYLDCPDIRYVVVAIRKWAQLVGWSVFRVRENRVTWGDALFDRRFADAPEILLRHIVPHFRVDTIDGWFPRRPNWFSSILASLRFVELPEPQNLSLMCVPFADRDAVDRMRGSLYYTAGDGDLF